MRNESPGVIWADDLCPKGPQMSALTRQHRGRVAALSRSRSIDDPDLLAARRDLAEASIAEHIAKVIAKSPPLTVEQRDRIAAILLGGAVR